MKRMLLAALLLGVLSTSNGCCFFCPGCVGNTLSHVDGGLLNRVAGSDKGHWGRGKCHSHDSCGCDPCGGPGGFGGGGGVVVNGYAGGGMGGPGMGGMGGPGSGAAGAMGAVAYPYYTTRGPRDFLLANPPSIGP